MYTTKKTNVRCPFDRYRVHPTRLTLSPGALCSSLLPFPLVQLRLPPFPASSASPCVPAYSRRSMQRHQSPSILRHPQCCGGLQPIRRVSRKFAGIPLCRGFSISISCPYRCIVRNIGRRVGGSWRESEEVGRPWGAFSCVINSTGRDFEVVYTPDMAFSPTHDLFCKYSLRAAKVSTPGSLRRKYRELQTLRGNYQRDITVVRAGPFMRPEQASRWFLSVRVAMTCSLNT